MSHCAYPYLRYSHHAPLFAIVVLGVVFDVNSSSNLSGGDGAVDHVVVGGVLQGFFPLPLLSLSCIFVAAVVVSLRLLLLLLAPSLLMNPPDLVIQTPGNNVSSLLVDSCIDPNVSSPALLSLPDIVPLLSISLRIETFEALDSMGY